MLVVCLIRKEKRMKVNVGRKETGAVGGKKGYIYSSACDLIHTLRFVGQWIRNGAAFILHNNRAPHDCGASRRDSVLAVMTVCNAGRCVRITYHFYRSDLVHLRANWVLLKLSPLCSHPTWLPKASVGKCPRHCCHRIANMTLFPLRCV